ncbi:MAG TPA: prolyl oligopeptidase family serine peptidase [Opitutaceae bacterium]|nr:prolyl oligopeptidase family serine peptidase [Opitutaceae bacterium]HND60572.1 prolyl oligopeptidase family serine peptidase [Opitutaceae bacterium]
MRTWLFLVLASALAGAPTDQEISRLADAARQLPAKAFFGNNQVIAPQLSPDGSKIAFLFPLDDRRAVGVFERATGNAYLVLKAPNESIDELVWKGNEHLIAYADYHGNRDPDIILTDLAGKKIVKLNDKFGMMGIVEPRTDDPENVVAYFWDRNMGGYLQLFNVYSGKCQLVFRRPEGDSHTLFSDFVVDGSGAVRFYGALLEKKITLNYRDGLGAKPVALKTWPRHGYAEWMEEGKVTSDGQTGYLVIRDTEDRGALYQFDTTKHELSGPVFVSPEGEIKKLVFSRDGNRLDGVLYEGAKPRYHWLNPERAALQASIEEAFPGVEVEIVSASKDGAVMIVQVQSDREPGAFFVLDRPAKSMALFKRVQPGLDGRLLRSMEPIAFKARDGLPLEGYITRPWASETGRRVPMVVLPHGGPFGIRDTWGYDAEVQFLASRGYAVLQVNFRGSGGYGRSFIDKGKAQWGRGMQDDLTDGVNWAISQGIADPKRVAIYGASYGGYAALAGVTLTPDLYCCAVNCVGATDLEITYHYRGMDADMRNDDFDYREVWVGPTKEYRSETSPIRRIERIKVPTFHAYGKNDPVVEFDHWTRLKRELKKYNKPFEFLVEEDQGHGFDRGKASIEFYERLERFLAAHLKE